MTMIKYNDFNTNNISLERESHTYTLDEEKSLRFTSVTTFISEFFDKFNSLKIATKLVDTVPRYSHLTVEELLNQWKDARDHGTKVHNEIEDYLLENKEPFEAKALKGIEWLVRHTLNEKHKLFSEKIIYSKDLKLAGSVDLIIHNIETDKYTIVDWKTNAKIPTNSYKGKTGTHRITSDIEDCKYAVYALQLSAYRFLLEKYYGLDIYRQFIVHLKDDKVTTYLTPYYKNHIEQLFNLRKH